MPLVPVMFTLDDTPEQIPPFSGLETEIIEPRFVTTKFDLLFNIRPRDGGVYGHIQYSTDLFDRERIDALAAHYRHLLEAAAAAPDVAVAEFDPLCAAERRQILVEWNDTAAPFPEAACLHQLVAARANEHPERVALLAEDRAVTYGELDAMAEAARARLGGDIGPGSLIALLLPQSVELVVAILAVLKSGAAYLPLEPGRDPEACLATLDRLAPDLVVAEASIAVRLAESGHRLLDFAGSAEAGAPGAAGEADPDSIAYVICSSGSTGTPKAIELRHRGVANNLFDLNTRFGVGSGDRVLFVSSPAFDMSVYETLGMLVAGATTVIPDPDSRRAPWRWLDMLAEHRITVWNSAPVLLELLVEAHERRGGALLPDLRLVLLGGDWIAVDLPDRLRAIAPNATIVSLGGATEASIHSTVYIIGSEALPPDQPSIPYGRPMANQRTYILDARLRPSPIGVPGELYLAGTGLARGYRGQAELTARSFIEHMVGDRRERLFKTGDLARWRRDGTIELLGRIDLQAKVHGQWVDLRAIEQALRKSEAVEDAVAVAHRGPPASVAAFVIPARIGTFSMSALRDELASLLPPHMVPAAIIPRDEFPKSANGKVDRLALAKLAIRAGGMEKAPEASSLEMQIGEVWCALLGLDRIERDANLFDLGCDSLGAIRAAQAIGRNLRVIDIFNHPTIAQLGAHLRGGGAGDARMLHRLTPEGRAAAISLVCIPYGGGASSVYLPLAEAVPDNVALWSVALPGHEPGRFAEPPQSIEETARACADEIVAQGLDHVLLYGHCAGSAVAVEIARQLEARGLSLCAVHVGGALPDTDPEQAARLAKAATDSDLQRYLQDLGAFAHAFPAEEASQLLDMVRHDLTEAASYFARAGARAKIAAPLFCLFGDQDETTVQFGSRWTAWRNFAEQVTPAVVEDSNHYFVDRRPEKLLPILARHFPAPTPSREEHA